MFKDTYISLIQENTNQNKLTVQIIADRAQLNRATFYLHYRDIEDFVQQMVDELLDDLYSTIKPASGNFQTIDKVVLPPRARFIYFLEYFYQNAALYIVMLENKDFYKRVFTSIIRYCCFLGRREKNKRATIPSAQ